MLFLLMHLIIPHHFFSIITLFDDLCLKLSDQMCTPHAKGLIKLFMPRVCLKSAICFNNNFKNNLGINHQFTTYLKKSWYLSSD